MASRLLVQGAVRDDLPQLLALYRHLNPADELPSLDAAGQRLEALSRYPGSAILVGRLGNEIVSSCTLVVVPNLTRAGKPYALIENVVTHSEHRGRGHGKAILEVAVSAAWNADCYKVMLMTGSTAPSTLAFYVAAGFEQSKTGFQIRRRALPGETDS